MKILYFAWLRTRVGAGEETVTPPPHVATVGALLDWLAARSAGHGEALKNRALVRVAVNQDFATPDTPVKPDDEIALFPPVTGGSENGRAKRGTGGSAAGPENGRAKRGTGG